jgi:Flp pilus assembly pilin Flp
MERLRHAWRAFVQRVSAAAGARAPDRGLDQHTDGEPVGSGERGQGLAEYALIIGLIAIVVIVSLTFLGGNINEMFWDPISEEFGEVLDRILG